MKLVLINYLWREMVINVFVLLDIYQITVHTKSDQ